MRKTARQQQIDSLRSPYHEDFFDRFERKPVRNIIFVWVGALLLNLIFWGLIIAMVIFGLSFII